MFCIKESKGDARYYGLCQTKKWWFLAAAVIAAAAIYGYQAYQTAKIPAHTGSPYKVGRGDIIAVVSATGTLSPVNSVDVSSRITGQITEVRVNENDMVKASQVIIVLDDRQLQAQLAQAGAKLENTLAIYRRSQILTENGALSRQQLDSDRTSYAVAQAVYDDMSSSLEDTVIRAPIDGMVIGKPIPAGQTVAPGISNPMVLLTVADLGKMQIQALVDESDIGRINLDQKVRFTVDAYPEKVFSGVVQIISNKANITQNVVYYTVYIDVDSPGGLLKPTMTARVSFNVGERNNVVMIPLMAIKDNKDGQRIVQLVGLDGKTKPAQITTGLSSEDQIEVVSGLSVGDVLLMPGSTAPSGVRLAAGGTTTLTYEDSLAISRQISGVSFVAPQVQRQYQAVSGGNNWITSMQGVTPDYMTVRNFELSDGTFITSQQLEARDRVAVLGKTVVDNLFGGISPVGQVIRINKSTFRVIGVLATKGQSAGGQDQDDMILVPLKTAQERMMGINHVQSISVQAENADSVNQVLEDVTALLHKRHRIQAGQANDFSVRNLTALMDTATETTDTITLLLGNTAAISLLVGGIGIMNIMLVSVTERTREIGVRKALGATFSNILLQFPIEAIVIGVTGGLIGILLGLGASYAISAILGWATVISGFTIALAFGFSVLIGVIFGLYPARKAARLDPIDALRYE